MTRRAFRKDSVVEYSTIIRAALSLRLQITARLAVTSPHCAPKGVCGRTLSEMMIAGALAPSDLRHNADKLVVAARDKNARLFMITKKVGLVPNESWRTSFTLLPFPIFKLLPGAIENNPVAPNSRHPIGGYPHGVFQHKAARDYDSAQTPVGFAEQDLMNFADFMSVA